MDFVCIDRLDPDGLTAHTLAVWTDGRFEDNVSYALKDTPCGDVVGQAVCCFPAGVQRSFPDDEVLQDLRAESYVGVTLFSHTGAAHRPDRRHRPQADARTGGRPRRSWSWSRCAPPSSWSVWTLRRSCARRATTSRTCSATPTRRSSSGTPELRITRFNRAFEELTQRSAEEVVGRHLELLFPEDERRAEALEHVTSATTGGERWQVVEIPILRADGEVRTVLWNSATVLGADGVTPVATIAQGQDITERDAGRGGDQAPEHGSRAPRRGADARPDRGQRGTRGVRLLHRPRPALAAALAQRLQRDHRARLRRRDRRDRPDYLRRIRDAAGHLGRLMDALLSLSQIGRRELELHDVDLSALAVASRRTSRDRPRARPSTSRSRRD